MPEENNNSLTLTSQAGDQLHQLAKDLSFDPESLNQIKTERKIHFRIRIFILGLMCACGALIVIAYVTHLIAPLSVRWLSESDLEAIRTLTISIISSLLLSFSIQFFTKSFEKKPEQKNN